MAGRELCKSPNTRYLPCSRLNHSCICPFPNSPRASFSQEERLIPLVGRSKVGRKGEAQKLYIQEMLFTKVLSFLVRRSGMTNWDRGGENDKENAAGEKEGWDLLNHWGVLQAYVESVISFSSKLNPGFLLCLLATCMQIPEVHTKYCAWWMSVLEWREQTLKDINRLVKSFQENTAQTLTQQ